MSLNVGRVEDIMPSMTSDEEVPGRFGVLVFDGVDGPGRYEIHNDGVLGLAQSDIHK